MKIHYRLISIVNRVLPRSLNARFLLIFILPMVLVQAVTIYMFYERHWTSMSRNMSASLAGEIALVVHQFEESPSASHSSIMQSVEQYVNLSVSFDEGQVLAENAATDPQVLQRYDLLLDGLKQYFSYPLVVIMPEGTELILLRIQMPEGILNIAASQKRLANPTTYIFVLWIIGTALFFLLISILFLRNQIRSIIKLARAAERFGRGLDSPTFKPSGALEIRMAAMAFIEMRERIKRLLTRRTQMLAGVSHDLRTPLTRIKLQLELMEAGQPVETIKNNVLQMERMLEGYLEFVRSDARQEPNYATESINIATLLQDVTHPYAQQKKECTLHTVEEHFVQANYTDLRRALTNLLDNAFRYAKTASVSMAVDAKQIHLFIDDDGPGIPEDKREEVFAPFFRLEGSRNQETGGIGLGLTVVRDIIHKHGGEVALLDSPQGGLRVRVTLPV